MIYKRGKIYWYKFMWLGKLIRETTKQRNDKVARQMESAHRASLAKGLVGIREKKTVLTLAEFCDRRFEPWARSTFERASHKSWLWYRCGIRALKGYKSLADSKLDEISSEHVADFAGYRQSAGLQVSSINSSLRVLRRILRLAAEWAVIETAPRVKLLPGERHREHVVTPEEEARYLAASPEPLASIAAVLVESGLRPEECFRMQWENMRFENGRHGMLWVPFGKSKSARRMVPMTPHVRAVLECKAQKQGHPQEGWVWPAGTRSGHVEPDSLKKQHYKALRLSKVRPFVLYSLRHTFLTGLGEHGCDAWTLARIAGHSSITVSARYVHPSEDAVLNAMEKLGGHKIGHSRVRRIPEASTKTALSA